MTRYVYPSSILGASTDPDGDPITISHLSLGAGSTPTAVDWVATPVVSYAGGVGHIEITMDGTAVYDDEDNSASHPGSGNLTPVVVQFRVADNLGAVSANIGTATLNMTVVAGGDSTAPTVSSVSLDAASGVVTLTFSEALQPGTGNLTIRDITGAATLETLTLPGALATSIAPGKIVILGTTLKFQPTAAFAAGGFFSARLAAGLVKDLSSNNNAAITDDSLSFRTAGGTPSSPFPEDPLGASGFRGWSPSTDYGTTADYIVDPAGGGTHTTIAAAMAAAVSGKVIAVKDGRYLEAVTLKSGVTLKGYGTDKPLISAQQAITGFAQCTSADSSVLGSVLGVNGSPVYKKTGIAKSSVPVTDLLGINVLEDDLPISNAQDRADKTFLFDREDEQTFYNPVANGGNFLLTGSAITGIQDPTVINSSRCTSAQLLAARVWLFADPNETYKVAVTAVDLPNNTITISGGKSVNNDGRKRFALGNMGFAMVPGTWIYVDGGGSTFDLYVYPTTSANISKITIASIKNLFTLASGAPANIAIKGFRFLGAAGQLDNEGSAIIDSDNGGTSTGLLIENCKFTAFENIGQLHYAAVKLTRANNFLIQNCSFEYCAAHGIWPTGSLITQDGATMRRNTFKYCGSAGAKAYKQSRYAFFHNHHYHCGFRSHGNLGNVYLAGTDSIWWGNVFDLCQGYLTTKTVNPHAAFNLAPCDSKSGQNRKFEEQGGSGTSYFFNNSSPPVTNVAPTSGFMAMDWGFGGKTCYEYNNVGHGISIPADQGGTITAKNNLVTYAGYSGSVGGTLDQTDFQGGTGKFDTTNVLNTNLAAIYKDYLNRDWSPASAASPLLTMATFDVSSIVTTLKAAFPAVPVGDWDLDCFGTTINWGALKMGADQSIHYP